MSGTLHGADLAGLDELADHFTRASHSIRTLTGTIGAGVTESDRYWHGPDAAGFKQQWFNGHRLALVAAADSLVDAADVIERNRAEQEATSSVDFAGPGIVGPFGPGYWPGPVTWPGDPGGSPWFQYGAGGGGGGGGSFGPDGVGFLSNPVVDFLLGDVANFWNGGANDGFPVGQLGAALLRVGRTAAWLRGGPLPTFNTGLVGRGLAGGLTRIPPLSQYGTWLGSPAATTFFKRAGIAGGLVGTGAGIYNLYQQGNPIDAFQENPAGYVADVASTAFSASTAAFFYAPTPLTAGLVIGTGLVWAGAEVVEHWDDITEWTSDAWDATTGWVGDVATDWVDSQVDFVSDAWDVGTGLVGGAGDLAGGFVDGVGDAIGGIGDWF